MELNSLQDFEREFDTEERCQQWMVFCRWGNTVRCPFCEHCKVYSIRCGKKYRCGNPICKKDFTVIVKSFIENTNIPLKKWMYYIYMYAKTNGRYTASKEGKMAFTNSYFIDAKIAEMFLRTNKLMNTAAIFQQACMNIFLLKKSFGIINRKFITGRNIIDPKEIINLSDNEIYKRVHFFTTSTIFTAVKRRYIFYPFLATEELITETFINLSEAEMGNVNGQFFIMIMRKTLTRLWAKHIKDTPQLDAWLRRYRKEYKQKGRVNLANWYIKKLISGGKYENVWKTQLTKDEVIEMIKFKRASLIIKRKKNSKPFGISFDEMIIKEMRDRNRMPENISIDY